MIPEIKEGYRELAGDEIILKSDYWCIRHTTSPFNSWQHPKHVGETTSSLPYNIYIRKND